MVKTRSPVHTGVTLGETSSVAHQAHSPPGGGRPCSSLKAAPSPAHQVVRERHPERHGAARISGTQLEGLFPASVSLLPFPQLPGLQLEKPIQVRAITTPTFSASTCTPLIGFETP